MSLPDYLAIPFAAGIGNIPSWYFFVRKSARQIGAIPPRFSLATSIVDGAKKAPHTAVTVGVQLYAQHKLEQYVDSSSLVAKIATSFATAAAFAAPLAIFNGITMKMTPMQAYRALNLKQVVALGSRDCGFVCAMSLVDPFKIAMKHRFGETRATDAASAFVAGGVGSLAGNGADVILTRSQRGLTTLFRQAMLGAPDKAIAVGIFALVYDQALSTLLNQP